MDKKTSAKVIQFPGRQAERRPAQKVEIIPKGPAVRPMTLGASVLAIALATIAVNQHAFDAPVHSTDLSSVSRSIASVRPVNFERNAAWEKSLAESLASTRVRDLASAGLGHPATLEEKLRWGTLEQKYTVVYDPKFHKISHILLQGESVEPSYILDRRQFLRDYGSLFDNRFSTAALETKTEKDGKMLEFYTVFDKERKPSGQVKFVLDRHERLLSLQVQSPNI